MVEYISNLIFKMVITIRKVKSALNKVIAFISKYKQGYTKKKFIKHIKVAVPVMSIILLIGTITFCGSHNIGFIVNIDGKDVPVSIWDALSCKNGNLAFTTKFFRLGLLNNNDTSYSTIQDELSKNLSEGCGLYINGELIGVLDTQENLDGVLNKILTKDSPENTEAAFVENVEKTSGLYSKENIKSADELETILNTPVLRETSYVIAQGDTPISLSDKFNMSIDELSALNCADISTFMIAGKEIKVKEPKMPLTVKVIKTETQENVLQYTQTVTPDNTQYKDYCRITQAGKNGSERCIYKVEYVDGKEVARTEISREIIEKPIDEIKTVGSKEGSPAGKSTGALMWPVKYTHNITSGFGMRWGAFHDGIDIAASGIGGKDIVAADGGVVKTAVYSNSGFGNHVVIAHSNGRTTLYGHCSSLNVKVGQKVAKGQSIARVGSTGRSTGNHVHFSVYDNGVAKNPTIFVS